MIGIPVVSAFRRPQYLSLSLGCMRRWPLRQTASSSPSFRFRTWLTRSGDSPRIQLAPIRRARVITDRRDGTDPGRAATSPLRAHPRWVSAERKAGTLRSNAEVMVILTARANVSGVRRILAGVASLGFGVAGWVIARELTKQIAGHEHIQISGHAVSHVHGFVLPVALTAAALALVSLVAVLRWYPNPRAASPQCRPERRAVLTAAALPSTGFVLEELWRHASEGGAYFPQALLLAVGATIQAVAGGISWLLVQLCLRTMHHLAARPRRRILLSARGIPRIFVVGVSPCPRSISLRRISERAPPAAVLI